MKTHVLPADVFSFEGRAATRLQFFEDPLNLWPIISARVGKMGFDIGALEIGHQAAESREITGAWRYDDMVNVQFLCDKCPVHWTCATVS